MSNLEIETFYVPFRLPSTYADIDAGQLLPVEASGRKVSPRAPRRSERGRTVNGRGWYGAIAIVAGVLLVTLGAPSWAALVSGIVLALASGQRPHAAVKRLTTRSARSRSVLPPGMPDLRSVG